MFYSLLFWSFLTLSSVVLFPVAVVIGVLTLPFDPRKVLLHRFTCFWASLYTWLNPAWPVTVSGREKIGDEATVMVANHLSFLDILVLFRLLTHFKWVSKVENFRVPFIGWNMVLNDYIPLTRGDRTSVVQMMRACERTLASGSSIMMFPEGTRSPSGRMRRFKTGAFELAIKSRRPIQPIVIQGTHDALPKRGFVLRGRHPIRITVLDVVPLEAFESMSVEDLTQHVHGIIASYLGEAEVAEDRPASATATSTALA
jgi:1-acyl-sn-glycerol-3-phosphate acyltransferase